MSVFARQPCQFNSVDCRPPKRMIRHLAVRIAEVNAVGIKRGAQRAARIAGRRRHEDAFEARLRQNSRVGDAVQRHATAQAQIRQSSFLAKRPRNIHQRVLEHALHAGRAIGEAPAVGSFQIDRLIRIARRPKQFHEPVGIRTLGRGVKLKIIQIECERAVRRAPDKSPHLIHHGRPAIAGQPHHFVFIFVHREAEIRREG